MIYQSALFNMNIKKIKVKMKNKFQNLRVKVLKFQM